MGERMIEPITEPMNREDHADRDAGGRELHDHAARDDRALAAATAAWLRMAAPLHLASVALVAVALLMLALLAYGPGLRAAGLAWGVVVLAGIIAWLYAARCRFDAEIFARWSRLPEGPEPAELAAFDRALGRLRGRAPGAQSRSLASRAQGARGLLSRQAVCVLVQLAGTLVAIVMH
jgi:hypothetical protein